MNARRSFADAHGAPFLCAMTDSAVTAHIWRIDAQLDALRLRPPGCQYTTASLVVPAVIHRQEQQRTDTGRWEGFADPLTYGQLLRMIWSLDPVELALVGVGEHINATTLRRLMFRGESEAASIAHLVRHIALAMPSVSSGGDLQVLLPYGWRTSPAHPSQR